MAVPTITPDGFRVPWAWSPQEQRALAEELAQIATRATYQGFAIEDAAGRRIASSGYAAPASALRTLDLFGFPRDFAGAEVLDVGCSGGFYSAAARLRGARCVAGVDPLRGCIDQARFLASALRLDRLTFEIGDERQAGGDADIVLNLGVLYHTKDPFGFVGRCAARTRRTMILETELLLNEAAPGAWFIEGEYAGDPTNWWIPGRRCVEGMARAAGFRAVDFRGFTVRPPAGTLTPEGYERQGRAVFICSK